MKCYEGKRYMCAIKRAGGRCKPAGSVYASIPEQSAMSSTGTAVIHTSEQ